MSSPSEPNPFRPTLDVRWHRMQTVLAFYCFSGLLRGVAMQLVAAVEGRDAFYFPSLLMWLGGGFFAYVVCTKYQPDLAKFISPGFNSVIFQVTQQIVVFYFIYSYIPFIADRFHLDHTTAFAFSSGPILPLILLYTLGFGWGAWSSLIMLTVKVSFDCLHSDMPSDTKAFVLSGLWLQWVMLFAVFYDFFTTEMSQRKRLLQTMEQERNFVVQLSHDLRTPLHALSGYLEQARELTSGPALASLQIVRGAGRTIQFLIDGMLDLMQSMDKKPKLRPSPFDLDRVYQDLLAVLQMTAMEKESELVAPSSVPRLRLEGDSVRLQQVKSFAEFVDFLIDSSFLAAL